MNQSPTCTKAAKQQVGALMVTVMVIIAALMLLGSLAVAIVVTDRNISRNQRMGKDAFYLADGGHPLAVSIIEGIAREGSAAVPEFSTDPHLKNEVMDYYPDNASLNDRLTDSPETSPDIHGSLFNQPLAIDVDRTSATLLAGGSAEFASAGEGTGGGGEGSKKILFSIRSRGCLRAGACSHVISEYRSIW
jgi:hypothetical protein